MGIAVGCVMKLKDARAIGHEELYERRKQAILLHSKGTMTRKEIGVIVGVGRDAVGNWVRRWKKGGLRALRTAPKGRPRGSGLTLSASQQKRVQKCLVEKYPEQYKMDFALWNRCAVQQLIRSLYGIGMPIRTVGHCPKQWGFTPQKPVKRAYERDDRKVREWMEETYPGIVRKASKDGGEIHWGDETGVRSEDQVGRGFAPRGKTPVRHHRGPKEKTNMISTVTNQGKVRFMSYEETMNGAMFTRFLKRLLRDAQRKVPLIVDNLPSHHNKSVKQWVAQRVEQIELHYLPGYSPHLNPDEHLNCDLKAQLSKSASRRDKGAFKEQTKSRMRSLARQTKRIKSYFTSSKLQYIAKAV